MSSGGMMAPTGGTTGNPQVSSGAPQSPPADYSMGFARTFQPPSFYNPFQGYYGASPFSGFGGGFGGGFAGGFGGGFPQRQSYGGFGSGFGMPQFQQFGGDFGSNMPGNAYARPPQYQARQPIADQPQQLGGFQESYAGRSPGDPMQLGGGIAGLFGGYRGMPTSLSEPTPFSRVATNLPTPAMQSLGTGVPGSSAYKEYPSQPYGLNSQMNNPNVPPQGMKLNPNYDPQYAMLRDMPAAGSFDALRKQRFIPA